MADLAERCKERRLAGQDPVTGKHFLSVWPTPGTGWGSLGLAEQALQTGEGAQEDINKVHISSPQPPNPSLLPRWGMSHPFPTPRARLVIALQPSPHPCPWVRIPTERIRATGRKDRSGALCPETRSFLNTAQPKRKPGISSLLGCASNLWGQS